MATFVMPAMEFSSTGVLHPMWRHDGKELIFWSPNNDLMSVSIALKPGLVEVGAAQFDPPYRPSLIERAFGFDESWGVTAENPDMGVWRLLPC